MSRMARCCGWVLGASFGLGVAAAEVGAQQIVFESELPRTLVFIVEQGGGDVATRDVTEFLREAGFPLVDPALAHTAAQRQLVQSALEGDEGAAVQLGRDFGAHMLVLGRADWGVGPNPADPRLMTGTAEVDLRVLRLDAGRVISSTRGQGRQPEATEQAARTAAIREAVREILQRTDFVGAMVNNWSEQPWAELGYFRPDPGSIGAALAQGDVAAPRVAILRTDVAPPDSGGPQSRGIGVIRRGSAAPGLVNRVELEGIVLGAVDVVEVEGVKAVLEPLPADVASSLGIDGAAQRFVARTGLPVSRDTVRVVARGPGGSTTEVIAAPRIDQRWAVIVGISDYQQEMIPDLAFAAADAQAFHDFLRSPAAGPFPEDHILFLKDGAATNQAIREALFVFLQRADWDDLVVIYFAGHGAPDPTRAENLYLLPHDADLDAMASTAFPMWDVKTALRRHIGAERVIVIADACHSGGTGGGEVDQAGNPIGGAFADLFTPSRRLTLTAADANELSFEDERWGGHGVFTHYLLRALRGEGDGNADGVITFREASSFVAEKVSADTEGRQNPQLSGLGDVPMAVTGASTAATGRR